MMISWLYLASSDQWLKTLITKLSTEILECWGKQKCRRASEKPGKNKIKREKSTRLLRHNITNKSQKVKIITFFPIWNSTLGKILIGYESRIMALPETWTFNKCNAYDPFLTQLYQKRINQENWKTWDPKTEYPTQEKEIYKVTLNGDSRKTVCSSDSD
jgi:hypothetical protein